MKKEKRGLDATHSNERVDQLPIRVSLLRERSDAIGDESIGDSESSLHVGLA